ncbi:glycoside hydrolase family 79 protein [Crassisporium funariophilum]|nr:glycoside hydrolase family 79 protein [Crassisporium funariophilum]
MLLTSHLFVLLILGRGALGVDVSISVTAPANAPTIAPNLVSFSIEQDRWTDYAGTTSRNQFFFNTLDNLGALTGQPPQLRIGADSEDRTIFSSSVRVAFLFFPAISNTTPYPEASDVVVGDGYYQAAQFLPSNTHVIWGLNFGRNNLTATFLEAKSLAKAFSSTTMRNSGILLDAIEIGNEADFYGGNGDRNSSWSIAQYATEWEAFATNVSAAAGLSATSHTQFWGGAFALSSHSSTSFSPQGIFAQNMLTSAPGRLIRTISQHRYSGSFCEGSGGLLQDLMTKATIRGNLTIFNPDIAVVRGKGLDYVLGETNSYACHGAPGVSNVGGAALWTLDYALFASQIGISRVFFHQGIGYKYSLVQPATLTRSPIDGSTLATPLRPHIQPQYYGAIIAAEAIGRSGSTRAVELTVNDSRIAGYAFYEGSYLKRAILINAQAFFTATTTERPIVHVNLKISGSAAPTTMQVKRLFVPHADDTAGLTWGSQTYETSDGRVSGSLKVTTINVSAGVDVQATEVVMLTFK